MSRNKTEIRCIKASLRTPVGKIIRVNTGTAEMLVEKGNWETVIR